MGTALSACQRIGSVNVSVGMGTISTRAPAGRCRAANVADQPAGTALVIDADYVVERVSNLAKDSDLSRFIL